jgi:arsenate reductase (thioredoxin)
MLNEMKSRTLSGKKKVLFLCTGNSCRSQMAEGYLRHFAGEKYEVYSAGLEPSKVNPNAIRVMKEDNVDISSFTSEDIKTFLNEDFDYIITVCDNAKESCPYFPANVKRIHWSFEDPADATGSEEKVLTVFRKVRDQIKKKIIDFY